MENLAHPYLQESTDSMINWEYRYFLIRISLNCNDVIIIQKYTYMYIYIYIYIYILVFNAKSVLY